MIIISFLNPNTHSLGKTLASEDVDINLLLIMNFQVMEEKLTATNVELATVTKADGFKVLSDDEVKAEIEALQDF